MKRNNSRSALFLGEILLALLIFALSSAVCIGLLFRAYRISEASRELNRAVFCAQNAAEIFKAQPNIEKMSAVLGGDMQAGYCYVYYNEQWQQTTWQNASFTMLVTPGFAAGLSSIQINISKGAVSIFELNAAAYNREVY